MYINISKYPNKNKNPKKKKLQTIDQHTKYPIEKFNCHSLSIKEHPKEGKICNWIGRKTVILIYIWYIHLYFTVRLLLLKFSFLNKFLTHLTIPASFYIFLYTKVILIIWFFLNLHVCIIFNADWLSFLQLKLRFCIFKFVIIAGLKILKKFFVVVIFICFLGLLV